MNINLRHFLKTGSLAADAVELNLQRSLTMKLMKPYTPSFRTLSLATCLLVAGTFNAVLWHAQSVAEAASPAAWQAPSFLARKKNPTPVTIKSVDLGQAIYLRACVVCHGQAGHGDGPAAQALNPAPRDLTDGTLWGQSDGSLFWKLSEGRTPMPAFKTLLQKEERWHVVNYLRTLSPKPPVFEVSTPYRQAISKTLTPYFNLTSALFENDANAAQEAIKQMTAELDELAPLSNDDLDEQPRAAWDDATQQLRTALEPLAQAQDLPALRDTLKAVSTAMVHWLDQFGHAQDHPLYQLHCDQAVDHEEVVWLQPKPEPQNPYLGQSESSCSKVIFIMKSTK